MSQDFNPLPINELSAGDVTEFDLYVRRGDRYILYRKKSTPITSDNIATLKKNRVDNLFVAPTDTHKYHEFMNKRLDSMIDDETVSLEYKCEKTFNLSTDIAKWIFDQELSNDIISSSNQIMESVVKLMFKNKKAAHKLALSSRIHHQFHTHALHVCIFGLALAHRLLGESKEKLIRDIGPGLFFHDIGMLSLPTMILERRGKLTEKEMNLVKIHPKVGYEMLSEMDFSEESLRIVLEHHERADGNGYPQGKRDDEISIYSKICSIAETFDTLNTQQTYRVRQPTFGSLDIIKKEDLEHIGWDIFENFTHLFYSPKPDAVINIG